MEFNKYDIESLRSISSFMFASLKSTFNGILSNSSMLVSNLS